MGECRKGCIQSRALFESDLLRQGSPESEKATAGYTRNKKEGRLPYKDRLRHKLQIIAE